MTRKLTHYTQTMKMKSKIVKKALQAGLGKFDLIWYAQFSNAYEISFRQMINVCVVVYFLLDLQRNIKEKELKVTQVWKLAESEM